MTMRDMATGAMQEVIFGKCRRSYDSNVGETITFNMNNFLHRMQVHRIYMSWHNGGLQPTSDIDNFSSAFNLENNTLISHVGDYFDSTISYSEPLVFDMTSDYNSVQNALPQIMTGTSSFRITLKLKEKFSGQVKVGVYVPVEYVETGTGVNSEFTYSPHSLKAT